MMAVSTQMKAWAAALTVVLALPSRAAELPDFGTPADTALSKSRESQIGRGVMLQLRNAGIVMDDPLLTEYVTTLGSQLASRANDGTFQFEFFVAKDDQINAFALPGGFVGINSGLIIASETESELAGVLAHEISHVTQRHIARAAYDNQRTSIMSIAALLAAVVLGASGNVSGQAMQGMMMGSQALAAQRQINFTRANESEADRVGMELLSSAGFDPYGMASFFDKLGKRYGGSNQYVPAILQSHPVTAERTAEARSRARTLPVVKHTDSVNYALTKARIQVLSATTPEAAFDAFRGKKDSTSPGDRYGLALASMQLNLNDNAEAAVQGSDRRIPVRDRVSDRTGRGVASERRHGRGATQLQGIRAAVPAQYPADHQLRRGADRRRQGRRSARAAARSSEQRSDHPPVPAFDRTRSQRGR